MEDDADALICLLVQLAWLRGAADGHWMLECLDAWMTFCMGSGSQELHYRPSSSGSSRDCNFRNGF